MRRRNKKHLQDLINSATIKKTNGLELKGCTLLPADYLGIRTKAAKLSLGFAVPKMQEVRILSVYCIGVPMG